MATQVGAAITGTAVHRKASSACCGEKLRPPAPDAEHGMDYECTSCGQGTERVLGDPVHVPAAGRGVIEVPGGEG